MIHSIELAQVLFKRGLAIQLQYRVAAAIWMIGSVIQPVIYLVVWTAVAQAQGGSVGGFTAADFAAYYIVLMIIEHTTFTWMMWEYDYRVRLGDLSKMLLLPLHPIVSDIADNLAYKLVGGIVLLPAIVIMTLTFRPNFDLHTLSLAAFAPALIMAFVINFMSGYLLALAAFWTTRVMAINRIYFVALLFFSGRLTPLQLLPQPLQTVANVLPFKWHLSFPVELFLGRLEPAQIGRGLLIQLLWAVLLILLFRVAWRRGVRKYAAFGS